MGCCLLPLFSCVLAVFWQHAHHNAQAEEFALLEASAHVSLDLLDQHVSNVRNLLIVLIVSSSSCGFVQGLALEVKLGLINLR